MSYKFGFVLIPLAIIGLCIVCFFCARITYPILGVVSDLIPKENRCLSSLPPSEFSEADLVGTWLSGYESYVKGTDTLVIRADGTYKQNIHTERPVVNYESDWQPWRLEYHASGIPYLHLVGMKFCAINPSFSCDKPTGRMGWHDFCEDQPIVMDNEGILIVLKNSLNFPMGSESGWSYYRLGP